MTCTTQRDGWIYQCESYRLGHKVCQHMMAAFILAASGSCESKKKVSTNFELPERWCRYCGSTDVSWSGSRLLKRMSTSEGAGVDRCSCNTCGRRFADRPGFEGRHYTEDIILFAIRLVARNMLSKDVARTIKDEKNVTVSECTIQRWVDEYPRMVAAFAKNLEIKECNAVSVDEKHYKSKGKARWLARCICMATRFIVASDHWPDKLNHDATPLLEKVVERLGGPPLLLLSDKLRRYKDHVSKDNRCVRLFRCVRCGFIHHADINAGCNIENHGRKVLGLPRRIIKSLSTRVDTALGIGLQDVEGGFTTDQTVSHTASQMASGEHSVKRQAWTEVEGVVSEKAHVVRLWDDV